MTPEPDPLLSKCEEVLAWLHESEDSIKLRAVIYDLERLRDRLLSERDQPRNGSACG